MWIRTIFILFTVVCSTLLATQWALKNNLQID